MPQAARIGSAGEPGCIRKERGVQEQVVQHDVVEAAGARVSYSVLIAAHTCDAVDFEINGFRTGPGPDAAHGQPTLLLDAGVAVADTSTGRRPWLLSRAGTGHRSASNSTVPRSLRADRWRETSRWRIPHACTSRCATASSPGSARLLLVAARPSSRHSGQGRLRRTRIDCEAAITVPPLGNDTGRGIWITRGLPKMWIRMSTATMKFDYLTRCLAPATTCGALNCTVPGWCLLAAVGAFGGRDQGFGPGLARLPALHPAVISISRSLFSTGPERWPSAGR